jgi:hypothetical protein
MLNAGGTLTWRRPNEACQLRLADASVCATESDMYLTRPRLLSCPDMPTCK